MVEDPRQWSNEKLESVRRNLEGMRAKYAETKDQNLLKGIHKVEEEIRSAESNR